MEFPTKKDNPDQLDFDAYSQLTERQQAQARYWLEQNGSEAQKKSFQTESNRPIVMGFRSLTTRASEPSDAIQEAPHKHGEEHHKSKGFRWPWKKR